MRAKPCVEREVPKELRDIVAIKYKMHRFTQFDLGSGNIYATAIVDAREKKITNRTALSVYRRLGCDKEDAFIIETDRLMVEYAERVSQIKGVNPRIILLPKEFEKALELAKRVAAERIKNY